MTDGPELIPTPEERRRNRENAKRGESAPPNQEQITVAGRVDVAGRVEMAGLDQLHKKAQQAIGGTLEPDEQVLVAQDGEHGAIVATNRRILVCKWGLTTGSAFGKQVNTWDLSNVSGIEHRKGMTTEAIVVQAPGAAPVTKFGRMEKGSGTVWQAPNAIFVNKKKKKEDQDVVGTLRKLVADHQGAGTQAVTPAADPVEQVRKFGQLRDEGLITEDEFQAKKRELLGL